ncbi:hypothetical protein FOCG_02931 [Fusarium oxysporum f. sp. radicis-lycopersici 26381]|jgi:hypothetical protein|uniref:Uncharacterized protein n=1 Tax=Fusarium oxysporum Fo47 TaxID=660027 RepID=W9KBH5_FUSOX|nr:hypothetical protein FOZG_06913 [Fusarium oxysporum Fo47]EXA01186.1 hypothetical protein FOWG_01133 [Fusarium oxysporum f. sp. lycopersici MN25]EXL59866.1 hypothetical protein FOCG_02931 [Fusarium oxysporum f. sp. radicis-lycopersici 26381]KAJ0152926.1 Itaconate transport protein [Fusarium oxysporum f. sp. albedinis]
MFRQASQDTNKRGMERKTPDLHFVQAQPASHLAWPLFLASPSITWPPFSGNPSCNLGPAPLSFLRPYPSIRTTGLSVSVPQLVPIAVAGIMNGLVNSEHRPNNRYRFSQRGFAFSLNTTYTGNPKSTKSTSHERQQHELKPPLTYTP